MVYVTNGATINHCVELAPRLRSEDLKEALARNPSKLVSLALLEALEVSDKTFSVIDDSLGCIAIFGVRYVEADIAIPWMVSSDELFRIHSRKFIRHCAEYVKLLIDNRSEVFNYVSTTNHVAHRWLTWLGFDVQKDGETTLNGVSFYRFTYKGTNKCVTR